jgi:hypothetical protein
MGRGINLSHIGHALQTDGDDGLPNRGLGAVGWRRNNGSWLSACLCRYVRRGSLRARGCGFRRRQTGNKFVQFSIADRSVSRQCQHGAYLKRLTLAGDYPT